MHRSGDGSIAVVHNDVLQFYQDAKLQDIRDGEA